MGKPFVVPFDYSSSTVQFLSLGTSNPRCTTPFSKRYEVLFHTWGSVNNTLPIILHGNRHHVTRNLESALRHLRLKDHTRTLWIDALCINQSDSIEKGEQVEQMRPFYTMGGASKINVWLGKILKHKPLMR